MRKSTKSPVKRRTILYTSVSTPKPKKKIARRARRETQKTLSLFGLGILIFAGTFLFLLLGFLHTHGGIISPLGSLGQKVLGTEIKEDQDTGRIKSYLSQEKISYATIGRLSGNSYQITLTTGEEVLITSDKDILRQLASLQLILTRLTMEGKHISRLDLRYDKPVITLK